ncbi:MAG: hydroxyethylthiazole kinase [Peptococcaceae bacterium]|nr:hydroxyethylthiazole kinase [Peptococcaceae bacterium]
MEEQNKVTILQQLGRLLDALHTKKPLIHHLTNYVTVNDCANATLAIGASPIMADDIAEAGDIAAIASALVINIGTLNSRSISSMLEAGKRANAAGVPVVFDPVGAGASALRNTTTQRILSEIKPAVIRGNISEMKFIAGISAKAKGVDAGEADISFSLEDTIAMAKKLSGELQCIVAITGKTDIITDGSKTVLLHNGHPMLSSVTGTGCLTSSLVGSYCGATTDYFLAAIAGILTTSIAGEIAHKQAGHLGTGSFHIALIDAISKMSPDHFTQYANITIK